MSPLFAVELREVARRANAYIPSFYVNFLEDLFREETWSKHLGVLQGNLRGRRFDAFQYLLPQGPLLGGVQLRLTIEARE